jgi:AraC family transcriptional regulator
MTRQQADRIDYNERLARVLSYIHDHLEEEIDIARLAEIACLSPYHWHRIYRAIQGETLAATVKRLRLHHAAGRLANSAMSVEEIASRAGYGSVHAFTRAFTGAFGTPPATFRRTGTHTQFIDKGGDTHMTEHPVEIRHLSAMRLATLPHAGHYMEIGKAFDQLFGWFASRGLLAGPVRSVGIFFDDPDSVPVEKLRSRAGLEVGVDFRIEPPLEEYVAIAGPYAVLTHKGPYSTMKSAYSWLYGTWLPASGREPADAPCLERYLNMPTEVPPTELLTEICLPLK